MISNPKTTVRANEHEVLPRYSISSTTATTPNDVGAARLGLVLWEQIWRPVTSDGGQGVTELHTVSRSLSLVEALQLRDALDQHIVEMRAGWTDEKISQTIKELVASGEILMSPEGDVYMTPTGGGNWRDPALAINWALSTRENAAKAEQENKK